MKLKKFEAFGENEIIFSSDVPQGHEWRHIFPHKFK